MTKELLEKVKKQLLNERTTRLGWTLPKWVAEELFKHIESLEEYVFDISMNPNVVNSQANLVKEIDELTEKNNELKTKIISQVITDAKIALLEEEINILRNGMGWARAQAEMKNIRNCLEIALEKADKLKEKSSE